MDAFISYRRDGGFEFSARLHERLRALRYQSFFDIESMTSGKFNIQILDQIKKCQNFILVLSPNALDRCANEGDWVRNEIKAALEYDKNIILLFLPGFEFPDNFPEEISDIKNYQGVHYTNWNFAQVVEKIISYLKDNNGCSLAKNKEKRDNNTYYNFVGISDEEYDRIDDEMKVSSLIEKEFLLKSIEGRSNLNAFVTSLYGIQTTYDYLSQPAFSKVFVNLASSEQRDKAIEFFSDSNKHFLYEPVSNNKELDALLSLIEKEHGTEGVDFVYSNLSLMDADDPLKKLMVFRDHLNDNGIIFIREIDDAYLCAYPDTNGIFDKAISIIQDDKYAGNRQIGREVYTLLKMVGAKEIHRCPKLLTTAEMSHRNKERTFHAWFGYQISEFKALLDEDPDNPLYKTDLEWFETHYDELEKAFLRDDFFFSCGVVYYYAVFEKEN